MKSVIGNNQNKAATSIKVGENIFSDTEDVCNELNKFFTNIAESSVYTCLIRSIPPHQNS